MQENGHFTCMPDILQDLAYLVIACKKTDILHAQSARYMYFNKWKISIFVVVTKLIYSLTHLLILKLIKWKMEQVNNIII